MPKTTAKRKLRKPARISAPREARKAQIAAFQASEAQQAPVSPPQTLAQPRFTTHDLLAQAQAEAMVRDYVLACFNSGQEIPTDIAVAFFQQLQRAAG